MIAVNEGNNDYYDEISEGYERLHHEEQSKKIKVIKSLLKVKPFSKILDVGCGPYFGEWDVDENNNQIKNLEIIGVDPSKKLLEIAAEKGIDTVNVGAENLPFPDNYFDYITSITAIQNFEDLEKGITEIKRVVNKENKNSTVVITFLKNSPKKELILELLGKHFNIEKNIEEDKDIIIVCKK
ncbi:methyltransferase domain-containing protein [Candidatus Woesearchaeota archaeon]|nr:methyltransferase domain-containing protein [Candidatus Woesearchaeota archaeon]MBT5272983.1 methyltransferase domain-containing protein [Candidatus Woesearchaeota archaeon]MBT6041449.1 methyltransferase domain-containing protein [Candidatus Woesearchaeota archaeon]MBT6336474.1 methyltransferase domain-containing protein [Candidatus Woesearchaeota archaeon]MBT7927364.1 methyltransferase domain-containing protein [Candidatus Woesearchaeota archaeon]